MHVANLPSRRDTKLCGFFSYNSTKQMLENPTYFLRRKQTFHVRILVLTRLDGQLITLLSHFPALRGSLISISTPALRRSLFSDTGNRVEVQKLKQTRPFSNTCAD